LFILTSVLTRCLQEHLSSYSVDDAVSNRFKTIVAFDCRGLEPVDFSPRNGWIVKGYKVGEEIFE
jgi:hypothetical protein